MNATKYLFAAACAAIACQAAQAETQAFRVNGQLVTKAQQDQILAELTRNGQAVTPQVEQQVKMTLVRDAVLLDAAAKQKLESRKEVRDAIESTRRQILIRAAIGEWVQKNPVPAADVRKAWDSEKARWGGTEVMLRQILLKDEAKAQEVLKKARGGEDFGKLAQSSSVAPNAAQGGLVNWISPNFIDKEFADAIAAAKPGEVCDKVFHNPHGWHVIKLENRRPAQRFADFKRDEPRLRDAMTQQRVQLYIQDLMQKAKITPAAGAAPKAPAKKAAAK